LGEKKKQYKFGEEVVGVINLGASTGRVMMTVNLLMQNPGTRFLFLQRGKKKRESQKGDAIHIS